MKFGQLHDLLMQLLISLPGILMSVATLLAVFSNRKHTKKLVVRAQAWETKTDELGAKVNGRLSELLEVTAQTAHAAGVLYGRQVRATDAPDSIAYRRRRGVEVDWFGEGESGPPEGRR